MQPAVYIVTNQSHQVLYVGVTSNIARRAHEHRHGLVDGFAKRYGCTKLVYIELYPTMLEAITREKQIKGGSRAKKVALIKAANPGWDDLYEGLV